MSRDPLEGVRPDDMAVPPLLHSGPPVSPEPAVSSATLVSPVSPNSGGRTNRFLLLFFIALGAILAGGTAYFMSIPHTPFPTAQPSATAEPIANVEQPSAKAEAPGDLVVTQGARPADDPSPAPSSTPK
ncbi:hypothetical protein FPZ24_13450 [Sphingomonas panacisoli]|uniref:Uncharacterized protein n=1 Tax=Sphingomonas panacisoli TaxID=1813879 RepID=A0A5B8LKB9_9SPHN|nr:hypothetical protein [Sphingomonas panacisoli]QDZ08359.1 hypothetical protein FPZ24_13450 [Sphingomonas panacisoli]